MRERLEITDSFFRDSMDFLARYRLTEGLFSSIKSRRFKLFIDLRIAYECGLKALIAYFAEDLHSRLLIIRRVESCRHDINRLFKDVSPFLSQDLVQRGQHLNVKLSLLPVALRYYLDGRDFLEVKEEDYYSSIGQDSWMEDFAEYVKTLLNMIDEKLQANSKVVSSNELWDIIINGDSYNKYSPAPRTESRKIQ